MRSFQMLARTSCSRSVFYFNFFTINCKKWALLMIMLMFPSIRYSYMKDGKISVGQILALYFLTCKWKATPLLFPLVFIHERQNTNLWKYIFNFFIYCIFFYNLIVMTRCVFFVNVYTCACVYRNNETKKTVGVGWLIPIVAVCRWII